jgi:cathepsin L
MKYKALLNLLFVELIYANESYLLMFTNFMNKYNRNYSGSELKERYNIFIKNLNLIKNDPNLGISNFMDYSEQEFKEEVGYGCIYDFSKKQTSTCNKLINNSSYTVLPDSIDWRDLNAVTKVKNQGSCGSCWSFSATGALEGAWAIKNNELLSLSEQQLIDCSLSYGNLACKGGLMDNAFEYAIDKGMCIETDEPYEANLESCKVCQPEAYFSGCIDVPEGNQLKLKEAVSNGPVSIAIEADTSVFQHYTSGIISSSKCGKNLDHGVLIVGYGIENDVPYWIVKNSWGEKWGDNGYVRLLRSESVNDDGVCGLAMSASQPIALEKNGFIMEY